MMLSPSGIDAATDMVLAEDFYYQPADDHLYQAILSLHVAGQPVDPVSLADRLGREDLLEVVGGEPELARIMANTPATSNAHHYATVIEEHATFRRLLAAGAELAEIGYSAPEEMPAGLDQAENLAPGRPPFGFNLARPFKEGEVWGASDCYNQYDGSYW